MNQNTITQMRLSNYSTRKLVVKNDRNDISKLDDLKGKKIAVTTSSEFNELVKQFNETANPPIDYYLHR